MTTWQQEVKQCAKRWHAKRKRAADMKAAPKAKPAPPKVPRRVRGKQTDPANDIN